MGDLVFCLVGNVHCIEPNNGLLVYHSKMFNAGGYSNVLALKKIKKKPLR